MILKKRFDSAFFCLDSRTNVRALDSLSVNGQAYSYDDNGNLLTDGTNTYTYDAADRLTSVTNGENLTQFAYNGLGNRLQQTVNGTATTYQLDLNTPLPQVLSDGTNSYLAGLGRIGEYGTSGWAYHHPDALGSVRLLTNGAGSVTGEASYTPFGEVMDSTTGSVFGFAGEQRDETGLQYLRARYYAPEEGRFLTTDPFSGMPRTPATLHPYMYGLNNPLIYGDPSGECYGSLAWMRNVEPYQCQQLDQAHAIAINPNASEFQQAWATGWITMFWTSHAALATGSAMLAGAYAAPYIPASVSSSVVFAIARNPRIATGAVGGISGFVGNIFGQATNNGANPSCINWTNALIAGVVGVGAGALAPNATTSPQAAMLGGNANLLQYFITQVVNGDSISLLDISLSYGTGAIAGGVGGGYEPDKLQFLLGHPSLQIEDIWMQAGINLTPIFSSNLFRNILGGYFTNTNLADTDFFQSEDNCGSEEPPVEAMEESPKAQGQILQETAEVNVCTN